MYKLHYNRSKDKAIYGPSLFFRILCLLFSIFLLYFFALTFIEGTYSPSALVPFFLSLVLLFSALLRDEFIFDKKGKEVTIKFGFGPFYKKEVIGFCSIKEFELTHFVKGKYGKDQKSTKHNKAQVVLALKLFNDEDRKMEVCPEKSSSGKLENTACTLSAFTSIPLFVDREEEVEVMDIKSLR